MKIEVNENKAIVFFHKCKMNLTKREKNQMYKTVLTGVEAVLLNSISVTSICFLVCLSLTVIKQG